MEADAPNVGAMA